jgi:uncharacterized damage-inducible protein DinB
LAAELTRERAALIASLLDLSAADLDRESKPGDFSIRQNVEHVLYWERDSMAALAREQAEARGVTA